VPLAIWRDLIEGTLGSRNLLQDIASLSRPDKWLGLTIVFFNVVFYGGDQFGNAVEDAASDALLCDVTEEPFHHVQPRGAVWRVVHLKAFVPSEPALHVWMLVSCVIIRNDVDLLSFGSMSVDLTKEGNPVLVGVTVSALTQHRSVQRVERRKQCGRTMPLVIVGHCLSTTLLHRQAGLRTIQRLDLALLVN
jgi:hypothetical protein